MHCLKNWKAFNDFIDVSEDGEVKSHGKIIKGEICKNGYRRIHVSNDGKSHKYLIHRLVAETFIPNPDSLPCVNHIDGNKLNCAVSNLEWCSYSYNQKHAFKLGLRFAKGVMNPMHKLTETEVKEIRNSYVKGKHTDCNSNGLAKKYNVDPKTILDIVNGKTWVDV